MKSKMSDEVRMFDKWFCKWEAKCQKVHLKET